MHTKHTHTIAAGLTTTFVLSMTVLTAQLYNLSPIPSGYSEGVAADDQQIVQERIIQDAQQFMYNQPFHGSANEPHSLAKKIAYWFVL